MRERMRTNKEDFDRIHRNHSIFIEAVERYDTDTLRSVSFKL